MSDEEKAASLSLKNKKTHFFVREDHDQHYLKNINRQNVTNNRVFNIMTKA